MLIPELAVILANEHQSDQKKKITNDFHIIFSLCIRSHKNDSVSEMPKKVASGKNLTRMTASLFHRI